MARPCLLYEHTNDSYSYTLLGYTSRQEKVLARITDRFIVDAAKISLSIDDILYDTPDNLGFVEALAWVIREVESLGDFVMIKKLGQGLRLV